MSEMDKIIGEIEQAIGAAGQVLDPYAPYEGAPAFPVARPAAQVSTYKDPRSNPSYRGYFDPLQSYYMLDVVATDTGYYSALSTVKPPWWSSRIRDEDVPGRARKRGEHPWLPVRLDAAGEFVQDGSRPSQYL